MPGLVAMWDVAGTKPWTVDTKREPKNLLTPTRYNRGIETALNLPGTLASGFDPPIV
jgi:hypothetical protein